MKKKEIMPTKIRDGKYRYRGYLICECIGEFGTIYYTIVNTKTNIHVHSKSLNIAKRICDEADLIVKKPYKKTKSDHTIYKRANELAVRTKRKSAHNDIFDYIAQT